MTPEELKQTVENVVVELGTVADIAAGVDPALVPFIAIGKAVSKQIPGLVEAVDSWLQGNAPTDAEKADLIQKISVLENPDLP